MARSVHDRVQGVGAREWGIIRETVYIATLFPIGEDETIKRSVNLAALTDDKAKEKAWAWIKPLLTDECTFVVVTSDGQVIMTVPLKRGS
jgi:hypothetical protein